MLTGVVAFLLLLIALLAIPITLTFRFSWQQASQNHIVLRWAFGLVRVRMSPFQPKAIPPGERRQKAGRSRRSSRRKRNVLAAVRQTRFRQRILRFISDLWRAVKKRNVNVLVRVGMDDPADTGQLWAVVGPMTGMLANVRQASIKIEPEFADTTFELDSSGTLRVVPLQVVYLTIALLLSPAVWRGISQMRGVAA